VETRLHVHRLELLLEAAHVTRDARADVRVQADRREALVLAVLREHLGGDREERLRELLPHDLGDARFVGRVEEREQEANGDRLDPGLPQSAHLLARSLLVERDEHRAVARDSLGDGQAVPAADDRIPLPRQILVVREVQRLLVPGDVKDVAVALGRDQADLRAVVLDDDVRRDRRPVEDLLELRRLGPGERGQLADPLHRPLRRVLGRRLELVDEDLTGFVVDVDQVRERAANVDPEAPHAAAPGLEAASAEPPPPGRSTPGASGARWGLRTIFPKCSRRSIVAIASRASSSGKTL
jgi:hypothetical protein